MMLGTIIGTIAIVTVAVIVGVLLDRKIGFLPRGGELQPQRTKPRSHGAGEAPATALRARPAQLDKLRNAQLCVSCRRPMMCGSDDSVRYDARDLLVLHFACPGCGAGRAVYIEQLRDSERLR